MKDPFGWGISTAEDLVTFYQLLISELERTVVGQRRAVELVAWLAARHVAGCGGQVAVLHGPPATGKSSVVRALSRVLDLPLLNIPADQLAETNWYGKNLSDFICDFRAERHRHDTRPIILVDNLDSTLVNRSLYRGESEQTRSYHSGKQQSLVALLDGEEISRGWSAAHALIFVVGNLPRIGEGDLNADSLYEAGVERPLAERLGSGLSANFDSLSEEALRHILRTTAASLELEFADMGFHLQIVPEVDILLARRAAADAAAGGLRAAVSWLKRAVADAGIRRLLDRNSTGEPVLGPDDIRLPSPTRSRWVD